MITNFACADTLALFETGKSRRWSAILNVATRKLIQLHTARELRDLRSPPGNQLELLKGDRAGQYSIRINDQWRVCFRWTDEGPADVEIVDYASAKKPDTPSGTARELAEALGEVRQPGTAKPVAELAGVRETRGAAIGEPRPVQVHSLRLPGFVLSCEAHFGLPDERLLIRHDAGSSAAPYVAGTLLAIRRVAQVPGLRRGLDSLMD